MKCVRIHCSFAGDNCPCITRIKDLVMTFEKKSKSRVFFCIFATNQINHQSNLERMQATEVMAGRAKGKERV